MTRTKIDSSAVAEVGYDDDSETLQVKMVADKNGHSRTYDVSPVHRSIYEAMLDPDQSAGRLFGKLRATPGVTIERVIEPAVATA